MAATLANAGKNPVTGKRVATAEKAEDDAKEAARRCAVARRGGKAK